MAETNQQRVTDEVLDAMDFLASTGEIALGEHNARAIVAEIRHHRVVEQKAKRVVELAVPGNDLPPIIRAVEELREVLR